MKREAVGGEELDAFAKAEPLNGGGALPDPVPFWGQKAEKRRLWAAIFVSIGIGVMAGTLLDALALMILSPICVFACVFNTYELVRWRVTGIRPEPGRRAIPYVLAVAVLLGMIAIATLAVVNN